MFLSLNTVLKVNLKKEETVENQGQLQQAAPHPHPDLLGTLITTFSPLLCRMFLVRVLKPTNKRGGHPRLPYYRV